MAMQFRPEIRAGELRRRVTFQQRQETKDSSLGVKVTWPTFVTRWAAIEPLSGSERLQYAQLYPELSVRLRVRYTKGLSPKMRGLYGARVFEILAVIDLQERHEEMHVMCRELETA